MASFCISDNRSSRIFEVPEYILLIALNSFTTYMDRIHIIGKYSLYSFLWCWAKILSRNIIHDVST